MPEPSITGRSRAMTRAVAAFAFGFLHLGFLALFMLVTLWATQAARAEPECRGKDLMGGLGGADRAEILRQAAETPNGGAKLFRIDRDGVAPSWVYGTMHLADPRVTSLPGAVTAAIAQSKTLAIETTDILDPSRMLALMGEQPELMMFTDDTTLETLLAPGDLALVRRALEDRGIALSAVRKMKPWMLSSMVAVPVCETLKQGAGAKVLDQKLAIDAQAAGRSVVGLETAAEQLGAMASLPMDFHIRGLVDTLALGGKLEDVLETMINLYSQGKIGAIWPLFGVVLPDDRGGEGYARFEETMVTARNRTMADRALPLIEAGGVFIAVGALHLPGEEGVIELLRGKGLSVTAIE